jgi:hypothetical protein
MAKPTTLPRPAEAAALPAADSQDAAVLELARAIFVRTATGPVRPAKTAEDLARRALEDAAAFYAVAAEQNA